MRTKRSVGNRGRGGTTSSPRDDEHLLPVFSAYDPLQTDEGPIDPLGLDAIAEKLAVRLVPAVRERMNRIRFLTTMTVGSLVTESFPTDDEDVDTTPHLVWEWLVVEALFRTFDNAPELNGVPGRRMALRAIRNNSHLSAARYLKNPETTGFHGVYKPLAVHLRLVDENFRPGPEAERLMEAWADGNRRRSQRLLETWKEAVERCLGLEPVRAAPRWTPDDWKELAQAFHPGRISRQERRVLRQVLLDESRFNALPEIWGILSKAGTDAEDLDDQEIVRLLARRSVRFAPLCHAILAYEDFSRNLQDAFDLLRHEADCHKGIGFRITSLHEHTRLSRLASEIPASFHKALESLAPFPDLASDFQERFEAFARPLDNIGLTDLLLKHHESVQRQKSAEGKRPWFHRVSDDTILLRYGYEPKETSDASGRFVHPYRTTPVQNFFRDLS